MGEGAVEGAKKNMGAIERLLKGLPVIRGYVDKELRRDADYRLRQTLATELETERQRLFEIQNRLARSGGLLYVDDADRAVQKLQTLTDRIRTASYGYAGLFNAVKIREEQLDALHRFDVALAARTYEIQDGIDALEVAVDRKEDIPDAIEALTSKVAELNRLFDRRHQAVEDPEMLRSDDAPEVDERWMRAADSVADEASSSQEDDDSGSIFSRIFGRDDE